MTEPVLAARHLSWEASGRLILGPLDLEVRRHESLVVVGPNGAGKTTLLRLLAGLLRPTRGEILLDGRPCRSLSRRQLARRIAYVPQLRPHRVPLTVEEVVLLGRYPYLSAWQIAPGPGDFAAVAEALAMVGIEPLRERRLDELSGGERQAVYIAAALAQQSEILILDEPTTHLDPSHQRDTAALLLRLQRQGGRTFVVATHDLNFASMVADRILALARGRTLACDRPAAILRPEVLGELFGAPFAVVRGGERPVTLLDLGP